MTAQQIADIIRSMLLVRKGAVIDETIAKERAGNIACVIIGQLDEEHDNLITSNDLTDEVQS